jgi:hypothetical protein
METLDDGQENLLADLFDVFAREVRRELEDEPRCRRVVKIEQRVPSVRLPRPATGQQVGFGNRRTHRGHARLNDSRWPVLDQKVVYLKV